MAISTAWYDKSVDITRIELQELHDLTLKKNETEPIRRYTNRLIGHYDIRFFIVKTMSADRDAEAELKNLEEKIDSVLFLYKKLQDENRSLRIELEKSAREHARLVENTKHAKNRVSAMISQLKSLGRET